MSNQYAFATVTAALKEALESAVKQVVGNAMVQIGRPEAVDDNNTVPTVNLFLYQVKPNRSLRNAFQPIRGRNGRLIERPYVAVDLDYLLSFHGNDDTFEPELMAAEAVRSLEARPILTREFLKKTVDKNLSTIGKSDLHKAPETVKATPIAMDLEALSKLWSIFFQVPYCLSVAYRFSYIIVEADEQASPALPVTRPVISPLPVSKVDIEKVEAAASPLAPIIWGAELRIRGRGLTAAGLKIRIGEKNVDLPSDAVQPGQIVFPLAQTSFSGEELPAGLHTVQAVQPPPQGVPSHLTRTTEPVPFSLRPTLALPVNAVTSAPENGTASGKIEVQFSPNIAEGQSIRLLLEEFVDKDAKNYILSHDPVPDASFPRTDLTFSFSNIKRATYLVMAQVDGVYSAPLIETDTTHPDMGQIKGPKVIVP